jgi:excisionase family DNA binding protein
MTAAVQMLRPREVGQRLRLGLTKIYELVREGELHPIYMNQKSRRTMRISEQDLAAFIAKRRAEG